MLIAVGFQVALVLIGALVAAVFSGLASAQFFLLGGVAATVPNVLFALRLMAHQKKPAESYPVVFFLGELIKIALTLGILGLVIRMVPNLSWLPLLLGLIVGLKAPWLALWFNRDLTPNEAEQLMLNAKYPKTKTNDGNT